MIDLFSVGSFFFPPFRILLLHCWCFSDWLAPLIQLIFDIRWTLWSHDELTEWCRSNYSGIIIIHALCRPARWGAIRTNGHFSFMVRYLVTRLRVLLKERLPLTQLLLWLSGQKCSRVVIGSGFWPGWFACPSFLTRCWDNASKHNVMVLLVSRCLVGKLYSQ